MRGGARKSARRRGSGDRIFFEQLGDHRQVEIGANAHDSLPLEKDDPTISIVESHAVLRCRQGMKLDRRLIVLDDEGTVQRLGVWGRERYDGLCLFDRGIVHGLDFATGRNRPRHHGRWRRPDRDRSTHRPCRDRQSGADAVGGKTGSGACSERWLPRGLTIMRFSAPAAHPAMEYAISRTGDRIRSRLCSVE